MRAPSSRLPEKPGIRRKAGVGGLDGGVKRSRARVNLFGTVDHEEIRRTLNAELAEQERKDAEKYNFNFRMMRPIAGENFDWMPVGTEDLAAYELGGMPFIRSHAAEEERPSAEDSFPASGPSNADEVNGYRPEAVVGESASPERSDQLNVAEEEKKKKRC